MRGARLSNWFHFSSCARCNNTQLFTSKINIPQEKMARFNSIILVAVCCLALVYPTISVSRWFSSSYADFHATLRRYGHCVGSLEPLSEPNVNQTDYLIKQIRLFLDEANLDNEQLANVSMLMDNICQRADAEAYPISVHLNVEKYSNNVNGTGKAMRCHALDQIMDSMYVVFKKSALNKSEPLDFSTIKFYTDGAKQNYYTVVDLINTSWIKSEVQLELVCYITDSVKSYVQTRSSKMSAQTRAQKPSGVRSYLVDLINSYLDSLFGLQKRIYWESNNRFEQLWSRVGSMFTSSNITRVLSNRTMVVTSTTPLPRAAATTTVNSTLAPIVGRLNSSLAQ